METQALTRENLMKSIHFERNFNRLMLLAFLLLLLQFIAMMKAFDNIFLADGAVFAMFVVYMFLLCKLWHRRFGNYKISLDGNLMFSQILWVVMKEHFQNVEFDSQRQIPEAVVRFPGFSFTESSTVYWPSRYATAQWGVTPIELQYMCLGNMKSYANLSEGAGEAATYTAMDPNFRGMLYLCHLGTPFTPTIVHTGKPLAGEIKTGDAAFDGLFSVRTLDPRTMPLSDGLRRFLTETVGKSRGKLHIHFAASGDVYLAFDRKIYIDRPRKDTDAFDKLDFQANVVKGLLNGLTRGF